MGFSPESYTVMTICRQLIKILQKASLIKGKVCVCPDFYYRIYRVKTFINNNNN